MLFDKKIDDLRLGRIKRNNPSPLHKALRKKKNIKVRKLLDEGADANMTNDLGETPLLYAIKTENLIAVEMLVKHGVDLEKRDIGKFTALGYAILTGNASIVDILLEYGADVNKKQGIYHEEPLTLVYEQNNYNLAQILFQFGAPVDLNRLYSICRYVKNGWSADLFMTYATNNDFALYHESWNVLNHICSYIALRGIKQKKYLKFKDKDHYKECIEELEKMKTIYLDERISSYDYLKASRNKLISYSKNKNLCDKLKKLLRDHKFINYEDMIKINIVIGDRYRKVYDKVNFVDPTGRYSLPILVRDNVLQYLNERDINNFIRS